MDLSNELIWGNLVLITYFFGKDFLYTKIFSKRNKINPVISIILAAFAIYLNSNLINEYNRAVNLSPVKGVNLLPPFTSIFIFADIISSTIILFTIFHTKINSLNTAVGETVLEILRLIFLWMFFTNLTQMIAINSIFKTQSGMDILCVKDQLVIDIGVFYFANGRTPDSLDEFTKIKVNPVNNSPVIFMKNAGQIYIEDEAGNILVQGRRDVMGLEINKNQPKNFFTLLNVDNKNACGGRLIIPAEFRSIK